MDGKTTSTAHAPQGLPVDLAASDAELVARARTGDFDTFEGLVGRHQERIYPMAACVLRNESDAHGGVQEAFLSVWKNLACFEKKSQFGSWLFTDWSFDAP